jgi:hypothetical protein
MASVLEQLLSVLTPEEQAIVKAKLKPELVARDKKEDELFGYWTAIDSGTVTETTTTTTETPVAAATHTPTVPSAATTTAAPTTVTTTAQPSADQSALLAALNGLKASMDGLKTSTESKLANVITKDQLPTLSAEIYGRSIQLADETFELKAEHKANFSEPLDLQKLAEFNAEARKAGTVYPNMRAAYNAMFADKLADKKVEAKVAEQVKQKLSAASVPGQTTSSALSPQQQVMAKARAKAAEGGTGANGAGSTQDIIARAQAMVRAREESNSSAVN